MTNYFIIIASIRRIRSNPQVEIIDYFIVAFSHCLAMTGGQNSRIALAMSPRCHCEQVARLAWQSTSLACGLPRSLRSLAMTKMRVDCHENSLRSFSRNDEMGEIVIARICVSRFVAIH